MKRVFISMALLASLIFSSACTQFPQLDHTITPDLAHSDYPSLLPIGPLLAAAKTPSTEPVQAAAIIDARVNALRARAARLRGSVLSGAERQRLANGLQ